jgi:predicted MFS family arabinose efflux permease
MSDVTQSNPAHQFERLRDAPAALWLVFAAAFLGWTFDAMDLNILTLVLVPTVKELSGSSDPTVIAGIGGTVVALKLFAWGIGGVVFGVLTDRFGRARILMITVLIYAVFTGLTAFATEIWQFALFQMLAGLGIGGEWAAGAALLAETWPEKLRPKVMQLMQMGFAVGFFLAALLNRAVGPHGWRWVFAAGLVPVLVAVVVRRFVAEPERWKRARVALARDEHSAKPAPPVRQLMAPPLRRSTVVGILTAIAMMVGCWGGLTWIPSWIGTMADPSDLVNTVSYAFMLLNFGAIVGYVTMIPLTREWGRKPTYMFFCAGALVVSLFLFTQIDSVTGIMWVMPLYGYFTIGGFGIFAIYLPELFPTVVRASGQGLCWNLARFLTGFGVLAGGYLVGTFGSFPHAAAAVSLIYVVGLVAIGFGPETRGRVLTDTVST